jgi:hypothetical protein
MSIPLRKLTSFFSGPADKCKFEIQLVARNVRIIRPQLGVSSDEAPDQLATSMARLVATCPIYDVADALNALNRPGHQLGLYGGLDRCEFIRQ